MHACISHIASYKFQVIAIVVANTGMRDLPDMYAQSPGAAGPMDAGIYIREITNTHVTSVM